MVQRFPLEKEGSGEQKKHSWKKEGFFGNQSFFLGEKEGEKNDKERETTGVIREGFPGAVKKLLLIKYEKGGEKFLLLEEKSQGGGGGLGGFRAF